MQSPTFSVVIPFHNAASTLLTTLVSLEASSLRPSQVVCVDDASTDNTVPLLEEHFSASPLQIILTRLSPEKRGAAAARNWGANQVDNEYLLFLDADVLVEPDTLRHMMDCIVDQRCVAVVATFRDFSYQDSTLDHFQAYTVNATFASLNPADSPCLGTQCVLMKTAAFRRTAGFSEAYPSATVEDFAFGYWLRASGQRICIAPEAGIVHNHHYRVAPFLRNYYVKARDLSMVFLANPRLDLVDSGYHETTNLSILLVLSGAIIFIALGLLFDTRLVLLGCVGVGLLPLVLSGFFVQVLRRCGLLTAILFTGIRIVVVLVGWVGVAAAFIQSIRNKRVGFITACGSLCKRLVEAVRVPPRVSGEK